jgi:hypothetical protein
METSIKTRLANLNIDLDNIVDEKIKEAIVLLFNLIEDITSTNRELQKENQRLRDEINMLKGEQGRPKTKPNKDKDSDISSEKERIDTEQRKGRNRGSKIEKIKIDRTEICKADTSALPSDAEFKGYDSVIVQDIKIETDNIEFKKEIYYSPSLKKTYRGQLPTGYEGGYGPNVKALTIIMKYVCNTSEPKILEFFRNFDIHISGSTISRMLTKDQEISHQEKEEIYKSGLESTDYQQIDDTIARVNGDNYHTHIVCNRFYSAYFTTKNKDRLTIIDILRGFRERRYCINEEALELLSKLRISRKIIGGVGKIERDRGYTEAEIEMFLGKYLPDIGGLQKRRVLEAAAIASYHQEERHKVVKLLLCDDAPQFKLVTKELALCWVHDGRYYKKLSPVVPCHVRELDRFRGEYWGYYRRLSRFKDEPCEMLAKELSEEFDRLFSTRTGYDGLDERIARSRGKKEELLMVLKYPEIPLHNNESELGARAQVRRRDVSLQTKTDEGTKASDTFLTIVQTAKKLGVNTYAYIFDRVSKRFRLPSLADIIREKSVKNKMGFCDSG